MDDAFYNRVGNDRIASRQIDELIGIARGLTADGIINQAEVEFLQKWLVANIEVSDQPLMRTLYNRVGDILADGVVDGEEARDLLDTLSKFSSGSFELGEVLKTTSLPLCRPAPQMYFEGAKYCFTGSFLFGRRKECEIAVLDRGAEVGGITKKTTFLVIGAYATESWKHSAFGNKILQACEWRYTGVPIHIVSEEHWTEALH